MVENSFYRSYAYAGRRGESGGIDRRSLRYIYRPAHSLQEIRPREVHSGSFVLDCPMSLDDEKEAAEVNLLRG